MKVVTTWASSIFRRPRCRRLASYICARLGSNFCLRALLPSVCSSWAQERSESPLCECVADCKQPSDFVCSPSEAKIEKLNLTWRVGVIVVSGVAPVPLVSPMFVSVGSSRGRFPSVLSPCYLSSCGDDGVEGC